MEHEKIAKEILSYYFLSDANIRFIRHNENITFKITDERNSRSYLLRIHLPVTEGFSGIQNTLEGLQAEMILLLELSTNAVIRVQKPIANRLGEYVTVYHSNQCTSTCYATLLTWIEGATLTLKEDNIERIVFALGEELATFHEFTRHFKPIKNLTRPLYDSNRINLALNELRYGVETALFNEEQYETIKNVLHIVKTQINELDKRESDWGLIHADLQLGNVIICDGHPSLIDFSLCGYGYYLFDLGSASSIIPNELRRTFLNGYSSKSNFKNDDLRYIEGLILMDIFISYCIFIRDSNRNGWINSNANEICGAPCKGFIEGESVYHLL